MELSNESLYELFVFFDVDELVMCSLACWNFYVLSSLESLWRGCIDKEHKELFGREMWYETCKVYRQIDVLRDSLKMNMTITELYTIKRIDASFRQLTALPSEIGQLTNLQELRLYDNKLTALPAEIGHLTNLRELYVSKLTKIPQKIQNMHYLRINQQN